MGPPWLRAGSVVPDHRANGRAYAGTEDAPPYDEEDRALRLVLFAPWGHDHCGKGADSQADTKANQCTLSNWRS
jgi:hypothetical protein